MVGLTHARGRDHHRSAGRHVATRVRFLQAPPPSVTIPLMESSMQRSLDTYILAVFALFFTGVLVIGGTSLFLVQRMADKTLAIEEESRNVDFINVLHNKTYSLMLTIHHGMVRPDEKNLRLIRELADEIDAGIGDYIEREEDSSYPEARDEVRLLKRLRGVLLALRNSAESIGSRELSANATATPLEYWNEALDRQASEIQYLVREINRHHFNIIARKVEKTRQSKSAILTLYLLFSLVGLVLVFLGYRLHSRHVVQPLKRLADAAGRISEGDLAARVVSDSRTEIGALCDAFNHMAGRLLAHEERLLDFHRELEDKVEERTSELRSAYDSLEQAQARALRYEKLAVLGEVAGSVNHEIRTPLNALYMNLQLIRRAFENCAGDCPERANIAERIAVIDREVLRIGDMLEEFVRYARLAPPRFAEIDVNAVVDHVANLLSERLSRSHVALELSLAEPAPRARADEDKLVQALVNLCINAVHAMPEGGRLFLATASQGDEVIVSVADTGTGIAEEIREKIFQPFFTSKESGMGFGLSIVQRVVEDHGGRVECESRLGAGSRFVIRLPVRQAITEGADDDRVAADR